jgi:excisionase family DNA binding protein
MTIAEFCRQYRLSRSTAYRLIGSYQLPTVKIGRAVRIKRTDAEAWLTALMDQQQRRAA